MCKMPMLQMYCKNEGICIKTSLGISLGPFRAVLDYFILAETSLGILLGAPKSRSRVFFFLSAPKASKSAARGQKKASSSSHAQKMQSDAILHRFLHPKGDRGSFNQRKLQEVHQNLKLRHFELEAPLELDSGLPFGRLLAFKMAENCLEIRCGPTKSRSRVLLMIFHERFSIF